MQDWVFRLGSQSKKQQIFGISMIIVLTFDRLFTQFQQCFDFLFTSSWKNLGLTSLKSQRYFGFLHMCVVHLAVRTNGAFFIKLMRQMLVVIIKA